MDQFKAMQVFVEIAEQGSMSRAARNLGVVNSVVTKNLNELESWLECKLFFRSTRSLRLTHEGEQLLEECAEILDGVRRLKGLNKPKGKQLSGSIKVTSPVLPGRPFLDPVIGKFKRTNPDVSIDLVFDNDYVNMVDKGFDVALRISELVDSNLISRPLFVVNLKLVASPGYIDTYGVPNTPREINQHQCIIEGRGEYDTRWRFIGKNGRKISVIPEGGIRTNDPEMNVILSKQGMGLSYLPEHFVDKDIKAGKLVELLPKYSYDRLILHLLYHHRSTSNDIIRAFVDDVIEYVKTR